MEEHFLVVLPAKGELKKPFLVRYTKETLIEWHLANSAADKNWVMAAEVERAEKKERK